MSSRISLRCVHLASKTLVTVQTDPSSTLHSVQLEMQRLLGGTYPELAPLGACLYTQAGFQLQFRAETATVEGQQKETVHLQPTHSSEPWLALDLGKTVQDCRLEDKALLLFKTAAEEAAEAAFGVPAEMQTAVAVS